MIWNKKNIAKEVVKEICERYKCDMLTSAILARRDITTGDKLMYYLEDEARYLHNPFLFNEMDDAVARILDAISEGEKILIFGDRDADGITSTTILYNALKDFNADVSWRIPTGNDAYGLSIEAVQDFAKQNGTLIITVDCGIANVAEIDEAEKLGIDVIVVDHHNPQELIPENAIIINPHMQDCGYPFAHLAGCGVTFKLVSALRFAKTNLYKQEICLLNVRPITDAFVIEALKVVNCCQTGHIEETIVPGLVSIEQTRLIHFLQGAHIFVWDEPLQKKLLAKIFGNSVEFNLHDVREEFDAVLPGTGKSSLLRLAPKSKIARYHDKSTGELQGFFNLFVTYALTKSALYGERAQKDLQLVMLGTLADLMPLQNENRILVKLGLNAINSAKVIQGLQELLVRQNLIGKKLSTTDIAWSVTPVLNAAGRLGKPEVALHLFLEEDAIKRNAIADEIVQMNKERRELGNDAWNIIEKDAYTCFDETGKKMIVVASPKIHRGVTGILATKLVQHFKVPAIVIAILDEQNAIGSARSTRGFNIANLLNELAHFFTNHGGHDYAAGFSLDANKVDNLVKALKEIAPSIEFDANKDDEAINIDAELPHNYLTPDLLNLVDRFEPYGEKNAQLNFMAKNLIIIQADILGKVEAKHLKLMLQAGSYKWPALYWNSAEKFNRDFCIGDKVDVAFQISRNTFNGTESAQMIIADLVKSN